MTEAESCLVIPTAVHALQQMQNTLGTLWEFGVQPLAEQLFEFQGEAQQNIARG